MNKTYKNFFYIPKHEKISEKSMLMRTATTVASILFCLAAMSITAYAHFSCNVTSANNIIKTANFETNVSVQITDANGEAIAISTNDYKSHTATLTANTVYFVNLKSTEKSTARTGFIVIEAEGSDDQYHTQQLGKDGEKDTEIVSFYLILGADTKITFLSHWGTSSFYGYENNNSQLYITQGETVNIPINGVFGSENQIQENDTKLTEEIHIVTDGENLTKIAEMYQTTVSRIAVYNQITDPDNIQVGQIIKIPPPDWVMQEDMTAQSE